MKESVKELREKEVVKLAAMYDGNEKEAKRIMNSFYRLNGFLEWVDYYENDYPAYKDETADKLDNRGAAWYDRLNRWLEPYNAELRYDGYTGLQIIRKHEPYNGAIINTYFYPDRNHNYD